MESVDNKTPKQNIFQRLFTRYNETPVSIVPDDDEDEDAVALQQRLDEAVAKAPVTVSAVEISHPETAMDGILQPEIAERAESVLAVTANFAQSADEVADAAQAQRPAVHDELSAKDESEPALITLVAKPLMETPEMVVPATIVSAAETAIIPTAEAPVAVVTQARVREEMLLPVAGPVVAAEPAVMIFAEKPRITTESVEAPTEILTGVAPAQAVQDTAAIVDQPVKAERAVLPAPTMRQWEFRQARKMRELAAANAEIEAAAAAKAAGEARAAADVLGSRRQPRPGLVSVTGRRVLIEDAFESLPEPVAQPVPKLVRSWTENAPLPEVASLEKAPQETVQPVRRWGMLSHFDARFKTDETEQPYGVEMEDELAMGTYGRGPRQG